MPKGEAAICPTSKTKTCRSAGRSTCCNWRPLSGSPSTFTMRSPTAMRPQASAGPPGFKIVTRLMLSRPRPRPDAQPSTVISYACMHVSGGAGRIVGRRLRGAASSQSGREERKWIVAHLGFALHTHPGLVNRLEVGGVAIRAPQAGVRVPSLTWQRRAQLLRVMIGPCGEQTQTWALAQRTTGWRGRGCAPYACGSETLVRTLTHPKSELNQDDIKSAMLLAVQKPAPREDRGRPRVS